MEKNSNYVPPVIEIQKPRKKAMKKRDTNFTISLVDNERVINTFERKETNDYNSTGYNSMARTMHTFYKK